MTVTVVHLVSYKNRGQQVGRSYEFPIELRISEQCRSKRFYQIQNKYIIWLLGGTKIRRLVNFHGDFK